MNPHCSILYTFRHSRENYSILIILTKLQQPLSGTRIVYIHVFYFLYNDNVHISMHRCILKKKSVLHSFTVHVTVMLCGKFLYNSVSNSRVYTTVSRQVRTTHDWSDWLQRLLTRTLDSSVFMKGHPNQPLNRPLSHQEKSNI